MKTLIGFCFYVSIAVITCENTLKTGEVCQTSKIDAAAMSLVDQSNFLLFSGSKFWEMGPDGKLIRDSNITDSWPDIDSVDGACSVSKGFTGNPQYIFIKDSTVYIYDVDKDTKNSELDETDTPFPEAKKLYCFSCFTEGEDFVISALEKNEGVAYKCTYPKFSRSEVKCVEETSSHPIVPGYMDPNEFSTMSKCSSIAFNTGDVSAVFIDDSTIYNFEAEKLQSSESISSTFQCKSWNISIIVLAAVALLLIVIIAGSLILTLKKRRKAGRPFVSRGKSPIAATESQIITIDSNTGNKIKHKH